LPLTLALADFKARVVQCESLIANAHKMDRTGIPILPPVDQQQITVAAFLNIFIAWETFLETSLAEFMTGTKTISGGMPVRYVSPTTLSSARELIIGVMKYFDYGNHHNLKKIVRIYFENGYPYEPHLSAIFSELDDLRTMRNASAHTSCSTQTALESLAVRIFGQPHPGITLYQLLTSTDPRLRTGETVLRVYKNKLVVAAEIIAQGWAQMATKDAGSELTEEEIARRRDAAIRRALNTPPKPLKEYVGKSKRAIAQRKSRIRKAAQSKPKSP